MFNVSLFIVTTSCSFRCSGEFLSLVFDQVGTFPNLLPPPAGEALGKCHSSPQFEEEALEKARECQTDVDLSREGRRGEESPLKEQIQRLGSRASSGQLRSLQQGGQPSGFRYVTVGDTCQTAYSKSQTFLQQHHSPKRSLDGYAPIIFMPRVLPPPPPPPPGEGVDLTRVGVKCILNPHPGTGEMVKQPTPL